MNATRKPLAVLLIVLCLAGLGGAAIGLTWHVPPAHAGGNDDSI